MGAHLGSLTREIWVARAFDAQGQPVPNASVQLTLQAVPGSGGHAHDATGQDPSRPLGMINGISFVSGGGGPATGTTGVSGFAFIYDAPEASGDYQIIASCTHISCTQQGPDTVWVGIPGLQALPRSPLWHRIGQDPAHPDNHYVTAAALQKVTTLATLYHAQFPSDPVLYFNDASLKRGGLFDIYIHYIDKNGILHARPPGGYLLIRNTVSALSSMSGRILDITRPRRSPTRTITRLSSWSQGIFKEPTYTKTSVASTNTSTYAY